ncbi:uncharacterized protein LOC131697382 [Acipenser ruthenus]|uniref:uncharacterized protein LOC131697382 n=1 Tax=Acipenser ruthenus TaxID=7906 RepID=UPI0027415A8B|nr:uncharacterized protein LOC131697382 [Acipenser ruthenus]
MDPAALSAILEALDSRREAEERRREERYTALIERVGMGMTSAATGPVMVTPKARAQKMTAEDDPEAYLVAFEWLATTAAWPREYWASQLGPCLMGEAQAAYRAMTDEDAGQYELVKQAMLRRLNITGETHRVRFQEFQRPSNTRPRVVAQRLCDHMAQWLNPSQKTGIQMGEAIVMEQFCHVVGAETQAWIRRHNPTTLEQAVALAENFEDSLVSARTTLLDCTPPSSAKGPPQNLAPGPRPIKSPAPSGHPAPLPWRQRLAPSWGRMAPPAPLTYQQRDRYVPSSPSAPPICFRCQQSGHIARYCPAAMECDVAACHLASETGKKWGNGREGPCIVDVALGNVSTHALVDTGCEQTLIRTAFLGGMSKTRKERRKEKWEGASMRHGWGLAGEGSDGPKRQSKGVGTQCDWAGEVTGPSRAETALAPVDIPDVERGTSELDGIFPL